MSTLNLNPVCYHREYANDFPAKSDKEWITLGKRVAVTALPFITLYKPLTYPVSLVMGGVRAATSIAEFHGNASLEAGLRVTVSVIAVAGTVFAHPLGMLITTGHDLSLEILRLIELLQTSKTAETLECVGNIANNVLYLALMISGGLEVAIVMLLLQALLGSYKSFEEFQKGNAIEACGHILMAVVRTYQMGGQIQALQMKWQMEALMQKAQQNLPKSEPLLSRRANKMVAMTEVGKSTTPWFEEYERLQKIAKESGSQELLDVLNKYREPLFTYGRDVLTSAVTAHDFPSVKILIEHGARQEITGYPAISIALAVKDMKIVKYLHAHGAKLDELCVYTAALFNFVEGLEFLLERHAPIQADIIPLLIQNSSTSTEVLKMLIRAGAKCDAMIPLQVASDMQIQVGLLTWAVPRGDLELVQLMVDRGAPLNFCMSDTHKIHPTLPQYDIHLNPLYQALRSDRADIASYLLSKGALVTDVHQRWFVIDLVLNNRTSFNTQKMNMLLDLKLVDSLRIQWLFDAGVSFAQLDALERLYSQGAHVTEQHLLEAKNMQNKKLLKWLEGHKNKP